MSQIKVTKAPIEGLYVIFSRCYSGNRCEKLGRTLPKQG